MNAAARPAHSGRKAETRCGTMQFALAHRDADKYTFIGYQLRNGWYRNLPSG